MRLDSLFDRLEQQENSIIGKLVLAPLLKGRSVSVKIGGVTCLLQVVSEQRAQPRGWGVLEVENNIRAKWVRPATRSEISKYLALLPVVRFIVIEREKGLCLGYPAHTSDTRFQISGAALIQSLPKEANVQPFDTILARFDGIYFWFDTIDPKRSPALAHYLRGSFAAGVEPRAIHKKGLSVEERAAYTFALYGPPKAAPEVQELSEAISWKTNLYEDGTRERLSRSLSHSDGQLISYIERDDVYTVTYRFADRIHTSTVRANDLTVVTSGICLSGYDDQFDLTSLVGVMQEAAQLQPWQFKDYDD